MKKKISNKAKNVLNKLFDATEDPSRLFLSDGERMKALHKMIAAKAAGWQKPDTCMYRGCSKPSIAKSHTIQRSGPISQLLEKGHVVTPRFLDGKLQMKSIGASDASTFPGFCSEHEAIFRPFEATSTIATEEHVNLQAFRTICRELRRKRYDIQHQQSLLAELTVRLEGIGRSEASAQGIEFKGVTVTGGLFGRIEEVIETGKQVIDRLEKLYDLHFDAINRQSKTQLCGYVAQSNITFPVALSGLIEHYARVGKTSTWIAGVIPQGGGSLIYLLGPPEDDAEIHRYTGRMRMTAEVIDMVEAWMVLHTDHWFLKPSVWASIPEPRRERILEDIMDVTKEGLVYELSIFDDLRSKALVIPAVVVQLPEEKEIYAQQRLKMTL